MQQEIDYNPRYSYLHQLELTGPLATLNRAALHYEKRGDITNSLKAVFLILTKIKQSNDQNASQEESKTIGENQKTNISIYSRKLIKDLLERAVFMSIKLGDFKQAMGY